MNIAWRMESLSLSGKIQCLEASAKILKEQAPEFPLRKRGKVAVKGKGTLTTCCVGGSPQSTHEERVATGTSFDEQPMQF